MSTPAQRAEAASKAGEKEINEGGGVSKWWAISPLAGAVDQFNLPGEDLAGDAIGAVGKGLVDGLKAWFTSDLMKRVGAGLAGILIILLVVVRLSGLGNVASMAPGPVGAAAKVAT